MTSAVIIILIIAVEIACLYLLKLLPAYLSRINLPILQDKFVSMTLSVLFIFVVNQLILYLMGVFVVK